MICAFGMTAMRVQDKVIKSKGWQDPFSSKGLTTSQECSSAPYGSALKLTHSILLSSLTSLAATHLCAVAQVHSHLSYSTCWTCCRHTWLALTAGAHSGSIALDRNAIISVSCRSNLTYWSGYILQSKKRISRRHSGLLITCYPR